jgi:hypothetical protein
VEVSNNDTSVQDLENLEMIKTIFRSLPGYKANTVELLTSSNYTRKNLTDLQVLLDVAFCKTREIALEAILQATPPSLRRVIEQALQPFVSHYSAYDDFLVSSPAVDFEDAFYAIEINNWSHVLEKIEAEHPILLNLMAE